MLWFSVTLLWFLMITSISSCIQFDLTRKKTLWITSIMNTTNILQQISNSISEIPSAVPAVESLYPALFRQASSTINGIPTEVQLMSFTDRILITISQNGRLAQWVLFLPFPIPFLVPIFLSLLPYSCNTIHVSFLILYFSLLHYILPLFTKTQIFISTTMNDINKHKKLYQNK